MGDTKIQWTEKVWNPVTGCTKISPGCQNCYAERMSKRLAGRFGYPKDDPFKVTLHNYKSKLEEPFRYHKPSRIFICSMGDLFHEAVPFEFIKKVIAICRATQWHKHLILTKRIDRALEFFSTVNLKDCARLLYESDVDPYKHRRRYQPAIKWDYSLGENWPLSNVWLGVTAENQEQADKRIPILLQIPAAVRFVSIEPMLGPINLTHIPIWNAGALHKCDCLRGYGGWGDFNRDQYKINWVIVGAESGPKKRYCNPNDMVKVAEQCREADVPVFVKQIHKKTMGGFDVEKTINYFPPELQVQQSPATAPTQ